MKVPTPFPLSSYPKITLAPTPSFSREMEEIIEREHRRLDEAPHMFDGPQLMALSASLEEVIAYEGLYSHYCAWQERPDLFPGPGIIGVGVWISNSKGEWLWQRTSEKHSLGSTYGFSTFGGVTSPDYKANALKEVEEELGLTLDDFISFEARGILVGGEMGAYVVSQGLLKDEAKITTDPEEVSEVIWVRDPTSTLEPIHPFIARVNSYATPLLKLL
jgi:8-oxo-dGTP pyrophosphatase MutT (NUDIX family)